MWKGIILGVKLGYGTRKISEKSLRYVVLQKQIRESLTIKEALVKFQQNLQEIQEIGKTSFLEFLNELYMEQRSDCNIVYQEMFHKISLLKDLSIYEQGVRFSISNKMKIYFMTPQQQQKFEGILQKYIQEIIEYLSHHEMSLSDAFNLLFIYRVYSHEELFKSILRVVDEKILNEYDSNLDNYMRGLSITLNQLSNSNWAVLSKFPNITHFLAEEFTVTLNANDTRFLIKIFHSVSSLKLHLVGPRKIPKCLSQIVGILAPKIDKLSVDDLSVIIRSMRALPAQFHPDFNAQVTRHLLSYSKTPLMHGSRVPIDLLREDEIELIFPSQDTYQIIWTLLVYFAESENRKLFFRGKIVEILRKLIGESAKLTPQGLSIRIQVARMASAGMFFAEINDQDTLEIVRKFCLPYLAQNIAVTTLQLSFVNYLNLLEIFKGPKYTQLRASMKRLLREAVNRRREKIKFNRHEANLQSAVLTHINTRNPEIVQIVVEFIKEIAQTRPDFNFEIETKILFGLFSAKNLPQDISTKLIEQLVKKLKPGEQRILADFFLLGETKNAIQAENMLTILIARKSGLEYTLPFVSSLSVKLLTNRRGLLNYNIMEYFLNSKIDFKIGTENIHTINRAFSILMNFPQISKFCENLYMEAFERMSDEIVHKQWKPKEKSVRILVDFVLKSRVFINQTMSLNTKINILSKVNSMLKVFMKFDPEIYLKTRYIEFLIIYKEYLNEREGQEIQKLHKIQKALQITSRPEELSEVAFIILKVYCLDRFQISDKEAAQYSVIVGDSVSQGRLNILTIKEQIDSINHAISIENLSAQSAQKMKNFIVPIVLKALSISSQDYDFKIVESFIKLFITLDENNAAMKLVESVMAKGFVYPHQILAILDTVPFEMLAKKKIMEKISDKIIEIIKTFNHNILRVLYYYEAHYKVVPPQISSVLFEKAQFQLNNSIAKLSQKTFTNQQRSHVLGRFPLYLFACIKTKRIKENSTFDYLIGVIKSNPAAFKGKLKTNDIFAFLNECLYSYALSGFKHKKSSPISIDRVSYACKELEEYLKTQQIEYEHKAVVNNVMVPYLATNLQTVILPVKSEGQGLVKFKQEVYSYLCECKVQVFNIEKGTLSNEDGV